MWETTGENIRNGVREFSEKDAKLLANAMFPIGSVYCGENSFILSVGEWTQITTNAGKPLVLGSASVSGSSVQFEIGGTTPVNQTVIRMWKRVH